MGDSTVSATVIPEIQLPEWDTAETGEDGVKGVKVRLVMSHKKSK